MAHTQISTPFDNLTNFDANILRMIDEYSDGYFKKNFSHWLFAYNLKNYKAYAFMCACVQGDFKASDYILSIQPNLKKDIITAMHYKCLKQVSKDDNLDAVKYLLNNIEDSKIKSKMIEIAKRHSSFNSATYEYLMSLGNCDKYFKYLFQKAIDKEDIKTVKKMLSDKKSIILDIKDNIRCCLRSKQYYLAKYLLSVSDLNLLEDVLYCDCYCPCYKNEDSCSIDYETIISDFIDSLENKY